MNYVYVAVAMRASVMCNFFAGTNVARNEAHSAGDIHCMVAKSFVETGDQGEVDGNRSRQTGLDDLGNDRDVEFVELVVENPHSAVSPRVAVSICSGGGFPELGPDGTHALNKATSTR